MAMGFSRSSSARLVAGTLEAAGRSERIPSNPGEAWLSDGRQVLHFKPVIWRRSQQELEVTSGEWLSDQPAPLLKRRQRLSREKAVALWRQRRSEGWTACVPQWQPPKPPQMVLWR
jgi:hypothetical protein